METFCLLVHSEHSACIHFQQNGLIEFIYDLKPSTAFEAMLSFNIPLTGPYSIQE